ncbi:MAG: L-threonylcarbamoyladenylate synthase [Thermodesulfobacteriota bacterium]
MSADADAAVAAAVAALRAGELVVFPTETLYGVGCDALNPRAMERLVAVKQRGADKGVAVLVADVAMLELVTDDVGEGARRLAAAFWPGPLTILFRARPGLPEPLVVDGRIGARVSSHPLAQRLTRELGRPLAAPSANPAGREPAHDVDTARRYFGDAVACYLDGGTIAGPPSTLADPGPPLRVLREGAVARAAIEDALRRADATTPSP